jgi:flagellar basal body-associated protein FliL
LQILLGSLIAALWGAGIWSSAASAHSALWKTFVIALDVAAMAASLAAMFWMVHKAAAHLDKKNAGGPSAASPAGL